MARIKQLVIAFLIAMVSYPTSSTAINEGGPLTVATSTATFHGKRIPVNPYLLPDYHGSVAAYTRIPYAEPPVGNLRFQRPVPAVVEGDFDATREGISCPQPASVIDFGMAMSEDCLYLDVFVPEPKPKSAAVMAWIHGGGFISGAGTIPRALPVPLAAMNDVIVVTMNYRLGVLGFLGPGGDDSPFNVGLLDQRQALIWIQENIAAFGGDPTRVTIFGESAGGFSVGAHVVSPMSAGLFSGAIMQSGTAVTQWGFTTGEEASKTAFDFGAFINCSASTEVELVGCFRQKSADDFSRVFTENPMAILEFQMNPTADGTFLPRMPKRMSAEGEVNKVNIMVGCLEEEGNMFLLPALRGMEGTDKPVYNKTMFDLLLSAHSFNMDQVALDTIALVYMSAGEVGKPDFDYADTFANIIGDWLFLCPTFLASEDLAAAGNPVYTYVMSHVPEYSFWGKDLKWLGATHAEDMAYVFGAPFMLEEPTPDGESLLTGLFNNKEVEMAKQVMKYFSNFAKTGNPNLSSKDGRQAPDSTIPEWPRYNQETQVYKDLSMTFRNREGHPSPYRCHFLHEIMPRIQENAAEMTRLRSLLEVKVAGDSGKSCDDPASCPGQ